MDIQKKIKQAPDRPGVYIMKDKQERIIYIGKAKSLKKRLNSYISGQLGAKTCALMSSVYDIEYRFSSNESMALLLEAGLIRKYKPKYNVSLRDDKSFPYVKITAEDFPAVYITRVKKDDGAFYFGPYTNVKLLREALKIIHRAFPFRACKLIPRKACIYYRIKLCQGVCIGRISRQGYADTIRNIRMILEGAVEELAGNLSVKMHEMAKARRFEEAALLRDRVLALSSLKPDVCKPDNALFELKEVLKLKNIPKRIEAFDVSNIFGAQATASMVSFYGGIEDKDNYRRFRIKSVKKIDDYKMIAEAVFRRYSRLKSEALPLPDMILVDGGRGQLHAVEKELRSLGLDIPAIGLAKKQEEIYASVSKQPIRLENNSSALLLIRRIRDESHRFALKYHHLLRKKELLGGSRKQI